MRDFYNQIVGLSCVEDARVGSEQLSGSAVAQWLEFPGCVFVRGEFQFVSDAGRGAIVAPGLFLSMAFDGMEVSSSSATRKVGRENRITAIAVRDTRDSDGSIRHSDSSAIGLAFSQAAIDELGLRDEFLALFSEEGAGATVASLKAPPRIQAIAGEMFSPPAGGGAAHLLLRAHAAEMLAHALFSEQGQVELDSAADRKRMLLQHVKDQMDADLSFPWSISELARRAGLSRRSFNQKFQIAYGESAIEYLRNRRLDAARAILTHQQVSVTEAAYRVGYAHSANFATAFRRRFGYSPSRCR